MSVQKRPVTLLKAENNGGEAPPPQSPNYKELGRRGGVASGAARRRRRELKEAAGELLALDCVCSDGLKALQALGQTEGDNTAAIMASILATAMRGNLDAVKFLRDLTAVKAAPEDRKVEFCFDQFEDITG